jgi:alkylhydroperoxidase family enzyme
VLAGHDHALAERHRVALALADALMTQPGALDDELVAALRREFTDEQLVELTLDVMKWNAQKVPVALGTDVWLRPGELTDLVFDEQGNWVR